MSIENFKIMLQVTMILSVLVGGMAVWIYHLAHRINRLEKFMDALVASAKKQKKEGQG